MSKQPSDILADALIKHQQGDVEEAEHRYQDYLEKHPYDFEALDPISQCISSSELTVNEVCMGDFNLNGERDITDLLILLVGIQPVNNFDGTFPETDCDCDGAMTTLDLLMFLPQFGNYCD